MPAYKPAPSMPAGSYKPAPSMPAYTKPSYPQGTGVYKPSYPTGGAYPTGGYKPKETVTPYTGGAATYAFSGFAAVVAGFAAFMVL